MPRKPRPDAPMFDLTGRVVLVTGASKGIGASIVGALGRQGATVIAHYGRDRKGAMAATKGIDKSRLKFISADLAKSGQADLVAVSRRGIFVKHKRGHRSSLP